MFKSIVKILFTMENMIKSILEKIRFQKDDELLSEKSDEIICKIKKENFSDIEKQISKKSLVFIDGGNLELIKSPSVSLFFNRVAYTTYKNNKRTSSKKIEFYSLLHASSNETKITYNSEYFFQKKLLDIPKLSIDSLDKSISIGGKRAQISVIGDIIRRLAELLLIIEIPGENSIIVLDGSLETKYPFEEETLKKSASSLEKNSSCLFGLSKTNNLLTRNGSPISTYLENIAEKKEWAYACDQRVDNPVKMHFIKLNKNSKYVFRLDSYNLTEISEALSLLKENSTDPVFLGYPYGLVAADRFARVSNREKEELSLKIMMKLKKDSKKLLPFLNSVNAHSILDTIS
jgi:hypothetical protein